MFWGKNKKNINFFLLKFSIFTKNICILHGHVFIMLVHKKLISALVFQHFFFLTSKFQVSIQHICFTSQSRIVQTYQDGAIAFSALSLALQS